MPEPISPRIKGFKERLLKTILEIRRYRERGEHEPFRMAQLVATKEFLIEELNN